MRKTKVENSSFEPAAKEWHLGRSAAHLSQRTHFTEAYAAVSSQTFPGVDLPLRTRFFEQERAEGSKHRPGTSDEVTLGPVKSLMDPEELVCSERCTALVSTRGHHVDLQAAEESSAGA